MNFIPDLPNAGIRFESGQTQLVSVPSSVTQSVLSSGEFTIRMYVKKLAQATTQSVCGTYVSTGDNRVFLVRFESDDTIRVFLSSSGASGTTESVKTTATYTDKSFMVLDVVVSISESSNADRVKVYVDGVAQTMATPTGTFTGVVSKAVDFNFGGRPSATESLGGFISGGYIFDQPLSSSEISTLYNSGKPLDPYQGFHPDLVFDLNVKSGSYNGTTYSFTDAVGDVSVTSSGLDDGAVYQNTGIYEDPSYVYNSASFVSSGGSERIEVDGDINSEFTSLSYTILTVVRINTVQTNTNQALWGSWIGTTGRAQVFQRNSPGQWAYFISGDGSASTSARVDSPGYTMGDWVCIAVRVDWTEAADADKVAIFRDGTKLTLDTVPSSSGITTMYTDTANDFHLLERDVSSGVSPNASMCQFMVVDTPLSDAQIEAWYNLGEPIHPDNVAFSANVVYSMDSKNATFSTNWTVPDAEGSYSGTSSGMVEADRVNTNIYG